MCDCPSLSTSSRSLLQAVFSVLQNSWGFWFVMYVNEKRGEEERKDGGKNGGFHGPGVG